MVTLAQPSSPRLTAQPSPLAQNSQAIDQLVDLNNQAARARAQWEQSSAQLNCHLDEANTQLDETLRLPSSPRPAAQSSPAAQNNQAIEIFREIINNQADPRTMVRPLYDALNSELPLGLPFEFFESFLLRRAENHFYNRVGRPLYSDRHLEVEREHFITDIRTMFEVEVSHQRHRAGIVQLQHQVAHINNQLREDDELSRQLRASVQQGFEQAAAGQRAIDEALRRAMQPPQTSDLLGAATSFFSSARAQLAHLNEQARNYQLHTINRSSNNNPSPPDAIDAEEANNRSSSPLPSLTATCCVINGLREQVPFERWFFDQCMERPLEDHEMEARVWALWALLEGGIRTVAEAVCFAWSRIFLTSGSERHYEVLSAQWQGFILSTLAILSPNWAKEKAHNSGNPIIGVSMTEWRWGTTYHGRREAPLWHIECCQYPWRV